LNPRERGFLLLSSHLGDPARRVLTTAQLRELAYRIQRADMPREDRELTQTDLVRLGYGREMAKRILELLEEEEQLNAYLRRGNQLRCTPVSRCSEEYPRMLRQRLGLDSPGCLWAKGDRSILTFPAIALVGSRELKPENRAFAEAVGHLAAENGLALVSGNARGADKAAQDACLESGGRVISVVADELAKHREKRNVLYLSEDGFEEGFSSQRALSRNRCIHALGQVVFVAQAQLHKGGTWDGTAKNLRFGWSSVVCFRDGSMASKQLEQMGAYLIEMEELQDFAGLTDLEIKMF